MRTVIGVFLGLATLAASASAQTENRDVEGVAIMAKEVADFERHAAADDASVSALTDAALIKGAQDSLRYLVSDPDAMKFQNVTVKFANGRRYVCGEVNAKNRYGAYVGYAPFISNGARSYWVSGITSSVYIARLQILGVWALSYENRNPPYEKFCR